jgi:hypothetical protein
MGAASNSRMALGGMPILIDKINNLKQQIGSRNA